MLLLLSVTTSYVTAADYFVAVDGRDSNSGTSIKDTLRTVDRAAELMQPGDTCWIRKGVYRETIKLTRSGQKYNPITFARYNEERVIIGGSNPVNGPWVKDPSGIWKTKFTYTTSGSLCGQMAGRQLGDADQ